MVALACLIPQAFRTAKDLDLVMGVTFGAIFAKALHTLWIFFFLAHGQFSGWRELVGHEDSVFFVCAISFAAALFVYDATLRRSAWFIAACPVLAAALALNLRRAGYVAFGMSALMMPFALAGRRRRAAFGVLVLAVGAAFYLLVAWNLSGPLAVPAEKVRSIFASADSEDHASNVYRLAENINLWLMVRDRPLGFGFGHPFETVVPLADLTDIFPNWRYHPHNMIFGLWMALGFVNFLIFVCYFSVAMMSASYAIKSADTPRLKATAFFCLSGLASALLVANLDQFIWAQRGALFTGVLLGITSALSASQGQSPIPSRARLPDGR
jgi:O-antigen ligase